MDVPVILQLLVQLTFNTAVHLREVAKGQACTTGRAAVLAAALPPVLCVLPWSCRPCRGGDLPQVPLGCYGLTAYASLFMSLLGPSNLA